MSIAIVYLAFALIGFATFRWCTPAVATLVVFLGGWIVLPVGHYPTGAASAAFPYWITGLAVPSDMLLTKAWVAPAVAVLGAIAFDRQTLGRLRPVWPDLPIALWCAWPLLQAAFVADARPAAPIASLYLAGAWGLPWLLGRAYFADAPGQRVWLQAVALSALACLPFSLIEGVLGPQLYGLVYEPHPFRLDGSERYLGFRPIGFFEHGNQFGLWVSLATLGGLWLARSGVPGRATRGWRGVAAGVAAIAIAAQSLGSILMLGLGTAFLWACRWLRPRRMAMGVIVLLIVGGATYVSGIVPITKIGKETALGRSVVDSLRAAGRGSFGWRIAQDQKLLLDAMARPVLGQGAWDWWRPKGARPWGLSVLVLGQFGLVGLSLCFGALLWPALREAWHAPRASGWRPQAAPLVLATIVVLAVFDALLNSFFFFPAIVAAGALAANAPGQLHGKPVWVDR